MQQVTVGTRYQIVIPKEVRRKIKGLRPGSKVMVKTGNKNTITIIAQNKDWLAQTRGMMKEAWKDIDPIAELEKMRNEWEHKT